MTSKLSASIKEEAFRMTDLRFRLKDPLNDLNYGTG